MQQDKKNKLKSLLKDLLFFILLITSVIAVLLLYEDKQDLEFQLEKRDKLIKEKQFSDSILLTQSKKNERIVEKYISDCGISINGKNVSTDELLKYLRNQINEIDSLRRQFYLLQDSLNRTNGRYAIEKSFRTQFQAKLKIAYDSLGIYKAFYGLAKRNLKTDFSVDGDKVKIQIPDDSTDIYKKLYELAKRDYGISYDVKTEGNYITYKKKFSTADSALMIFEYYKDKLSKDTLKNIWYIDTPRRKGKNKN